MAGSPLTDEFRGEEWTLRSQGERNQQSRVKRSNKFKRKKQKNPEALFPKPRKGNITME